MHAVACIATSSSVLCCMCSEWQNIAAQITGVASRSSGFCHGFSTTHSESITHERATVMPKSRGTTGHPTVLQMLPCTHAYQSTLTPTAPVSRFTRAMRGNVQSYRAIAREGASAVLLIADAMGLPPHPPLQEHCRRKSVVDAAARVHRKIHPPRFVARLPGPWAVSGRRRRRR